MIVNLTVTNMNLNVNVTVLNVNMLRIEEETHMLKIGGVSSPA
jgi:hypothetical protein